MERFELLHVGEVTEKKTENVGKKIQVALRVPSEVEKLQTTGSNRNSNLKTVASKIERTIPSYTNATLHQKLTKIPIDFQAHNHKINKTGKNRRYTTARQTQTTGGKRKVSIFCDCNETKLGTVRWTYSEEPKIRRVMKRATSIATSKLMERLCFQTLRGNWRPPHSYQLRARISQPSEQHWCNGKENKQKTRWQCGIFRPTGKKRLSKHETTGFSLGPLRTKSNHFSLSYIESFIQFFPAISSWWKK